MTTSNTLLAHMDGDVLVLTLNRPDSRNALNGELFGELRAAISRAVGDPAVRALVLTGAGKGFSAGADLSDAFFGTDEAAAALRAERLAAIYDMVAKLRAAPFPTIAAINGACAGSGFSLAALTDIRIMSESARIHLSFARAAVFPDVSASVMLPRLVGTARAIELTLLDRPIDADHAVRVGLATQKVAADDLMSESIAVARELAARSPLAVARTRWALTNLPTMSFDDAIKVEAELLLDHMHSPDVAEAAAAFLERRAPRFTVRPEGL